MAGLQQGMSIKLADLQRTDWYGESNGGLWSNPHHKEMIRTCHYDDLPSLEWHDDDTHRDFYRQLIQATFEAQDRGEAVMLVAEVNDMVCGQVWLDFTRLSLDATGVIWAVHVNESVRNRGIGTRLMLTCEKILRHQRFARAELSVEKTNQRAFRLYKRLGYQLIRTRPCPDGTVTFDPVPILVPATQWLMRKPL